MTQSKFQFYPEAPGHKGGGTSKEAAVKIRGRAAVLRQRVLDWFRFNTRGTADECAEALGESILAIRPRVSELKTAGEIRKTSRRKTNQSGMTAAIYTTIPKP